MAYVLYLAFLILAPLTLTAGSINKNQIPYLMQAHQVEKSIALYNKYHEALGKHDFEVLQQIAFILLEQGAHSPDQQTQLLSIFGSGIASAPCSLDILESGIKSAHAETQVASIQLLGRMQDDRSDELLVKAMSSQFFFARMEAAMHLANRKHKTSVGQIESLMYRVPPEARFFFPQFFALIGTSDAIAILRHLMEDRATSTRVEALLSAARFGRDDLLPTIRMNITHLNVAEQEAASYAVGLLKDSRSVRKLQKLLSSSSAQVALAAARSLSTLGDEEAKQVILEKAKEHNLFAIALLAEFPEGKNLLASLCTHPDLSIRMNATMALIKHRDPRCLRSLQELLIRDVRDMGFSPSMSLGKTLLCFKPIFSAAQQSKQLFDVRAVTLSVREQLLVESMHLPEDDFLALAASIFYTQQTDLIPTTISLLENLQTPKALAFLQSQATSAGMPLVRTFCTLALYRLGQEGPYEQTLKNWIEKNKDCEMIRFRPMVPMDQRFGDTNYELTPEDNSKLLVEAYQTLAEKQQSLSIDILLDAICNGNPKNRYVLAGLLLRTLQ